MMNKELEIQSEINTLLLQDGQDRKQFAQKLKSLEEKFGSDLYPLLLFTTAHLEFNNATARKHWQEVLRHWDWMSRQVKKDVDLRVALLDYFIDINRRIKNPKIIEIKIFQRTQLETYIDELTQLHNYRYFTKALDDEIARANRYNAPLSLVIFDIDDFKVYNDTNGHLKGNKLLKKFAKDVKECLRTVDIFARYGGEEFTLILPETTKEGALVIAERIRRKVEEGTFVKGGLQPLKKVTVSGGVASLNEDAEDASTLVKKADQALYRAKSLGKNQVVRYVDERRISARAEGMPKELLSLASEEGERYVPRNISEEGILFQSPTSIPLGTDVRLSLNFKDRKAPVPFKVKIQRVEKLRKSKKYEIGASIVQIKEPEKKIIQRFVRAFSEE